MLASRNTNFVKRLFFGCNDASFLRTHIIKVTFHQLSIVLIVIGFHEIWFHRIRKESVKYFFGTILLYLFSNASFDFKPSLFEQAWPHVDAFDGLRKKRSPIAADDIIIDEDELLFGADIHS